MNSASGLRNNPSAQSRHSTRTRTFIIAGSPERRARLEKLLRELPSIDVTGALTGAAGMDAYVEHWRPEAVIVDLASNFGDAGSAPAAICGRFPGLAVVALVDDPDPAWIARMLRSGVSSILERDASREQIAAAIQAAAEELIVLQPEMMDSMLEKSAAPELEEEPLLEELTRREVEVLGMVAEGLGNREIASRLGVSEHTIKFHISSILGKLGASSRTEAVTCGIKRGLILL